MAPAVRPPAAAIADPSRYLDPRALCADCLRRFLRLERPRSECDSDDESCESSDEQRERPPRREPLDECYSEGRAGGGAAGVSVSVARRNAERAVVGVGELAGADLATRSVVEGNRFLDGTGLGSIKGKHGDGNQPEGAVVQIDHGALRTGRAHWRLFGFGLVEERPA